jgi:hypothetical protein
MKTYTVYASLPETPRGRYDEEFDVVARGPEEARRKVNAEISRDYDPRLHIRLVVARAVSEVWVSSTPREEER